MVIRFPAFMPFEETVPDLVFVLPPPEVISEVRFFNVTFVKAVMASPVELTRSLLFSRSMYPKSLSVSKSDFNPSPPEVIFISAFLETS